MKKVDFKAIEEKWQKKWFEAKIFEADPDWSRPKCFVTFPFPYMSGPLHVGHAYSAARVDVYARYKRMCGFNVLFPWAWHWTGETVAGASERIKLGDEKFIQALREVDGVPEDELKKFVNPAYMAEYYTRYNREAVKKLGLSIDWRREFHTSSLCPTFSKFIEWQYLKLKERGYVIKGTHPVVWCPKCESPTGEADRLEGSGVYPEEYTLVKFRFNDFYLPAATLRPETIFGVTNLWINPDATYVKTLVDGERWIISKEAAEKLKEQLKKVEILDEIKGLELIGKTCMEPVNGRNLLILPGWFVDPDNATGVVYSVPAHAPYDWLALKDLQENPELLKKFNIDVEDVKNIKPISIVKVEGFGDFPAIEIVSKMNIKDQGDPKAEEATKIIYKKEFHTGILKENCGNYANQPISRVKQQLIEDFKDKGFFDVMYELPEKVVCRCTTRCVVKVLQDQWFLNYSNPEWKEKAKNLLSKMKIYPEEARKWFEDVIDWLHDWACTRKTGLGTPLPWAKDWIVETLSDSTIYPAFYTVNKHIRMYGLKAEQLTENFFDYVFYGLGDAEKISKEIGIPANLISDIRKEFLYWYPIDLRNSGKDLVPNHLTFYIFHHAALFPPEHWPKAVGVNGFMRVEGEEMHKSKGNFIPLRQALDDVGADITRCTVLLAAEDMDDPNWRNTSLIEIRNNLNALYNFLLEIREIRDTREDETHMDRWLLTSIYHHVEKVSKNIEVLKTRTALETALYEVWRSFRWYLRRVEKPNRNAILKATSVWVRILAPFIPHLAEELWEKFGEKGFISTARWPRGEVEPSLKDEVSEELIQNLFEDTKDIVKVIKVKPKRIFYYVASDWKWKIYLEVLSKRLEKSLNKGIIKNLISSLEIKEKGALAAKYIKKIVEDILKMPEDVAGKRLKVGFIDEYEVLMDAKKFFEKEFNALVYVFREDDKAKVDPKGKSQIAEPYRPAIFIEE